MAVWEGYPTRRGTRIPALPVKIRLPGGRSIHGLGLVASRAEFTMVPASLLAAHGDGWDDLARLESRGVGAGGEFEMRERYGVGASHEGVPFASRIVVAEPRRFDGAPLLGRKDFFATFHVRFAWFQEPPEFEGPQQHVRHVERPQRSLGEQRGNTSPYRARQRTG